VRVRFSRSRDFDELQVSFDFRIACLPTALAADY